MDLVEKLRRLSQIVEDRKEFATNEANTASFLIEPFLRELGFDPNNPYDVDREHIADVGSKLNRADYLLKQNGIGIILVEMKQAGTNLSKWVAQLDGYFRNKQNVKFGVLTNGIEYRFYTDLDSPNILDAEPFLTVDMLQFDGSNAKELSSFTKSSFEVESAKTHARKLKEQHKLRSILVQEFRSPSDDLIKLLIKRMRPELKHVSKKVTSELKPTVEEVWRELVEEEIAKRLQSAVESNSASDKTESEGTDAPKRTPPQTTGRDIPIIGYYEGHRFEAELLRNTMGRGLQIARNHIRYNGKSTWLKNAAVMAIRSVDPSFQPTRTYPNGFTFWYVVDPADGKEHMIRYISGWEQTDEALRQRVLDLS